MEYLSDTMLLGIVIVNIVFIIASDIIGVASEKRHKKMKLMVVIFILSVNLILDIGFMAYFAINNAVENWKIFVLFIPLTGWILYEAAKELWTASRS